VSKFLFYWNKSPRCCWITGVNWIATFFHYRTDGSIKRANKKDGSEIKVLKSNIEKLQDIKIFNVEKQIGKDWDF
jgi:hypothetical protein